MEFGIVQLVKFAAEAGSYSLVTDREVFDSQITATDAETILLRNYFLQNRQSIHVGNVKSNPQAAAKTFRLYPSGKPISLNLIYPKPEKSELRLYISKTAGFFPNPGEVWFLFIKKETHDLWIGSMPEKEWRRENSIGRNDEEIENTLKTDIDEIDAKIIEEQSNNSSSQNCTPEILKEGADFIRRRELAILRMQRSKYKCEFDPSHKLFIAKATGCPYLEAHHLIPIRFQPQLHSLKLDSLDNICCLCPNCHRAIHHAEDDVVKAMLQKLSAIRKTDSIFHLKILDLERLYSVEEITR
ncbi:HNH endonuclease [Candidatus Saccharibacteria bacterium]|nr:HNH endonuclease [Candidatus Saccharibacteria bacterium]